MKTLIFSNKSEFYQELKRKVEKFLKEQNLPERDDPRMYAKSFFILSVLAVAYIALVFHTESLLWAFALSFIVAQGFALVGFNVQHDGNHGAYSKHQWVNNLFGHSLNLIGGVRWLWAQQHNRLHHTYTNIDGWDNRVVAK